MSCPSLGLCKLGQNNPCDWVYLTSCLFRGQYNFDFMFGVEFEGRMINQSLIEAEREGSVPHTSHDLAVLAKSSLTSS